MPHVLRPLALLPLGLTPLQAQGWVTSPSPFFAAKHGQAICTSLGQYPEQRVQLIDGTRRGKPMRIKELAFRQSDFQLPADTCGAGRAWSRVRVSLADGDAGQVATSFATNLRSTPTQLFDAAVAWPRLGTRARPATYFGLTLPLRSSWAYAGTRDLCADITFSGGSLSNAAPFPRYGYPYATNGFAIGDAASAPTRVYPDQLTGCRDSQALFGAPGTVEAELRAYGQGGQYGAKNGKTEVTLRTRYCGQAAPIVLGVNFPGSPQARPWPGVACNPLFLDPSLPLGLELLRGSLQGVAQTQLGLPGGLVPYQPALAGLPLVAQALWNDSISGALHLSQAVEVRLPFVPMFASAPAYGYLSSSTPPHVSGFVPKPKSGYAPVLRYAW